MKILASNSVNKKFFHLFTLIFLIVAMSSCEKKELTNEHSPYNSPTNVVIESFEIDSSAWCCIGQQHKVELPSTFYKKGIDYDYVKVFMRVKATNDESYIWKELPYESTSFEIEDYKIHATKNNEIDKAKYYFRIKMKIRKRDNAI